MAAKLTGRDSVKAFATAWAISELGCGPEDGGGVETVTDVEAVDSGGVEGANDSKAESVDRLFIVVRTIAATDRDKTRRKNGEKILR